MRLAFVAALLILAAPAGAQRREAAPHRLPTLSPAEAVSRAAAASPKPFRAVFRLRVANIAKSRDGYYLDSERNFRSPANLAVAIRASAMPGLSAKYGGDLRAAFAGKTIEVIGEARRLSVGKARSTATQVEVTHAGQILSVS
jgi:hypothetical protein